MVGFVALTMSLFSGANIIFDKGLGILKRQVATASPALGDLPVSPDLPLPHGPHPRVLGPGPGPRAGPRPGVRGTLRHRIGDGARSLRDHRGRPRALSDVQRSLPRLRLRPRSPQSYFGLVNLLNLPILFTSNALYPPTDLPEWLRTVTAYNPVSLCINVMRENLFSSQSYYTYSPEIYLLGLLAWAVVIVVIALVIAARALRTP